MDRRHPLPFQHLTADNWLNLATASLLAFFLSYLVLELTLGRLCTQIGVDYCAYWSAGSVADAHGYRGAYDLRLLGEEQQRMRLTLGDGQRMAVLPFSYLPVFLLPFRALAQLPPLPGFFIWSLLNTFGLWLYLHFFSRKSDPRPASTRLTLMLLVSLPVFLTALTGQVSMILVVCAGEFMRALAGGKSFRAGLWLGGLLLKPQLLILLAPVLLLSRRYRVLAGLAASSLAAGLVSMTLVGMDGLLAFVSLWREHAEGRTSVWIEGMMNFRMLGLQLSQWVHPWLAWGLAMAGMLIILGLTLSRWRLPRGSLPTSLAAGILGILAATVTIAWHSHIHMATVLLPSMIVLFRAQILPARALYGWVFVPSFLFVLAVFLPPVLLRLQLISNPGAPLFYLPFAAAQLGSTLYLFWWALRLRPRPAPEQ